MTSSNDLFIVAVARLWPSYTSAHNNLGFYLPNKTEAMMHLREAIKLSPCHANAHSNVANIYHKYVCQSAGLAQAHSVSITH